MKVRELLTDASKWTTICFARNSRGYGVTPQDSTAVRWCLLGAMYKCYQNRDDYNRILHKVEEKLQISRAYIPSWNDTHCFDDVKSLVEELDI